VPDLRHITPLAPASLRGVTPNDDVGEPPEMRWVDPRDLLVDETYQRRIGEKGITRIRQIIGAFDWASFEPPLCVETEAGLLVTNGQHSATAAASHPRVQLIPVMVSQARDAQGQAQAFVNVNANRIAVTTTQLYHSRLAAGDEETLAVAAIAAEAGVRVVRNAPPRKQFKPGDTASVSTIFDLYRSRGPAALQTILRLLASRAPVGATELRALELLMFDPDYRRDFDPETVGPIVAASSGYEQREAEAIAQVHVKPLYAALAMVWYRRVPRRIAGTPAMRRVG
jgi:hypothetical protein